MLCRQRLICVYYHAACRYHSRIPNHAAKTVSYAVDRKPRYWCHVTPVTYPPVRCLSADGGKRKKIFDILLPEEKVFLECMKADYEDAIEACTVSKLSHISQRPVLLVSYHVYHRDLYR